MILRAGSPTAPRNVMLMYCSFRYTRARSQVAPSGDLKVSWHQIALMGTCMETEEDPSKAKRGWAGFPRLAFVHDMARVEPRSRVDYKPHNLYKPQFPSPNDLRRGITLTPSTNVGFHNSARRIETRWCLTPQLFLSFYFTPTSPTSQASKSRPTLNIAPSS